MEKCRLYYDKPAHSIREIKENMNTKLKGDIFEHLSYKYFKHCMKLQDVWLLKDAPAEILTKLNLRKHDLGIDLIGRDSRNRFYAIQAKYRKKNQYKSKNVLGWKTLSTFYGLVVKTGPWFKHVIITNADYVRHIGGKKTFKDKSICLGTLRGIKLHQWQEMAELKSYSLIDESREEETAKSDNSNNSDDNSGEEKEIFKINISDPKMLKSKMSKPSSLEELRERRLAFFDNF
tara:strand:- start:14167 stop:14865 length:699 start_codon:yes stop_codon:yes gene_type:complete